MLSQTPDRPITILFGSMDDAGPRNPDVTLIPMDAINDVRLTFQALGLLSHVASLTPGSVVELQDLVTPKDSLGSLQEALECLIVAGYAHLTRMGDWDVTVTPCTHKA